MQAAIHNRHPVTRPVQLTALFAALPLGLAACQGAAPMPAAPPAALDVATAADRTVLTSYVAYLRDPSGSMTAAEVAAPDMAARFLPFGGAIPNVGFSTDTFWMHLALANPSDAAIPLVLHLDWPGAHYLELYAGTPTAGGEPAFATGVLRPYATRPLPGRGFGFPIIVPAAATTEYYLRLNSALPIYMGLDLWQPPAFHDSQDRDEIAWGIVLGMLLLMTGYNLLLYIALRDANHLVLVVFGLLVVAGTAVTGGYAARWLPPEAAGWWPVILTFITTLVIGAFALLAISFLDLRRRQWPAWRVLTGALAVVAAAGLLALLGRPQPALALSIAGLLVILPTIFIATLVAVRQGSRLALFLLLSQVIPIITGMVQSLSLFGIGPKLGPLPLLIPINSLLLLTLMSLALADRVNLLRQQTDAANAALRASEQRPNTYLDALPFNIQVHDAQLKPLYVNSAIRGTRHAMPPDWYEQPYTVWVREEGQVALEAWAVPLTDEQGQISAIVTAFQDITQRRATEDELASYRDQLERRVAQRTAELAALNANLGARVTELTAVNEVSRRVMRIGDLQAALDEVAQIVAEAFQVGGATISLFDAAQQTLQVVVLADRSDGPLLRYAGHSFAYTAAAGYAARAQNAAAKGLSAGSIGRRAALDGTGAALDVLRSKRPLAIADACADGLPLGLDAPPIRSWLGAPLVSGEGAIGVLSLDSITPGSFAQPEAELLTTFADQSAIAVVNARLYEQAQASAIAGERERIARDLHDAVTQTIFSASLIAATLPERLPALPVEVDANCDPPYAVKIAFYRVAQEALNNVSKHAKAAHVTIRYSARPGALRLAVIDDGQGFAPHAASAAQMGLANMQERAAAVGAQLTIDSEPGLGTHLFMTWNEQTGCSDENNTQAA